MITHLRSPSVCVIDDEPDDYEPIMDALVGLGIGCLHVKGQTTAQVPPKPIKGLRVVFTDLHLSGLVGKDAASHCAMVFSKVVSQDTAPLIVVIWSKYSDDAAGNIPQDDQPTEADLFKMTLIDSFPVFKERVVFLEMKKPKLQDRPGKRKWITELKRQIKAQLAKMQEFEVLWAWEALVRDAAGEVIAGLTTLALPPQPNTMPPATLPERLRQALKLLVREQGGPDCSATTAPRHFAAALGQSLLDQLEHLDGRKDLARHGKWLSDPSGLPKVNAVAPGINGFLLTSAPAEKASPFVPGSVYCLADPRKFEELFGVAPVALAEDCYGGPPTKLAEWKAENVPKPVLIEISPACDVHQGVRRNALLIGGLVFPATARKSLKRAESVEVLPTFCLRWPADGFPPQSICLVLFSRLKVTLRPGREPRWLSHWFRLRELPTASLRNWHASHAARVGYVSVT